MESRGEKVRKTRVKRKEEGRMKRKKAMEKGANQLIYLYIG